MSLLVAALLYPYAIDFASMVARAGALLLEPTPLHWAILFLVPLVMAASAVLIAVRRRLASSGVRLTHGS
jgi:predicted Co/Zn/Cd cation transporter (cation efflux family)